MLYAVIFLNAIRFMGLELAPPGFYMDEAAGATQVMCISEDGIDFFGNTLPLFARGFPDAGLYTPLYLYGQVVWTFLFGNSVAVFRGFSAFATSLTVLFLYLWLRNQANARIATYAAFVASVMPWAFQFSRIAWDPPIAVLFLVITLWASTLKRFFWVSGIFLACAIYSYPPMRITALVIWCCLPTIVWRKKIMGLVVAALLCIPLALQFVNPDFMARTNSAVIWSSMFSNPNAHAGFFELTMVFLKQLITHFSISFLFLTGDFNLRHSSQFSGMLGWLSALVFVGAFGILMRKLIWHLPKPFFIKGEAQLFLISIIGVLAGFAPAALTIEDLPHALRAIAAWPFFALFCALILTRLEVVFTKKSVIIATLLIGLGTFGLYLNQYFRQYPQAAFKSFLLQNENAGGDLAPITKAYEKLRSGLFSCSQLRKEPILRTYSPIKLKQAISFISGQDGAKYLGNHWSVQEAWGIWSEGKKSDLRLPLPLAKANELVITMRALVTPAHPNQNFEIWVNQELLGSYTLSKADQNAILIPLSLQWANAPYLHIEFRFTNPVSPFQLGISKDDKRLLAIGLESVIFY